jgi:serine O-acetyltransferase
VGDQQGRCLCATVAALKSLYATAREDRPDSLLGDYPDPTHVVDALKTLIDAMFPGRLYRTHIDPDEMSMFLTRRLSQAWRLLRPEIERALPFRWLGRASESADALSESEIRAESLRIIEAFHEQLPSVRENLIHDVEAAYNGDPAALTFAEVQLAYPGLLAVTSHRLAHELYLLDVPVVPRIMSEWTHARTGVDIHPGARIGHTFFIDHATGVVIGETTRIGDRVKIYQGVTLGAQSFPLDADGHPIKRIKRHPTVEDDVVIYANATILGGDTVIGKGSTIGGNVFLMESVPPESFVAYSNLELHIKPKK